MKGANLAILASGSGTNAEAIMKYFENHPDVNIVALLSNNPEAFALERARRFNVPTRTFNREQWREPAEIIDWLDEKQVTHLVLAGFLWLVPGAVIAHYPKRIVNIHPALLPKYGGKGMYGMKVHEAVKQSGDTETGITIHEVNERYDEGQVIFQASCPVLPTDTPDTIAGNIHKLEYAHFPRVIADWISSTD